LRWFIHKKGFILKFKFYRIIHNLVSLDWIYARQRLRWKRRFEASRGKCKTFNGGKLNQSRSGNVLGNLEKRSERGGKTWKFKFWSLFKKGALILWVFIAHWQLQAYWWFLNFASTTGKLLPLFLALLILHSLKKGFLGKCGREIKWKFRGNIISDEAWDCWNILWSSSSFGFCEEMVFVSTLEEDWTLEEVSKFF
jgi:hypothetical protein